MVVDADLIARMDTNLAGYWGGYALAEGSRLELFPGAALLCTPIPLSLFNTVILTGKDPAAIDAAIESAAEYIAAEGRPVLWRLSPSSASDEVRTHLESRGLSPQGGQPAMLADLTAPLPPSPRIDGLEIRTVEGRDGRRDWAWLACDAFELDSSVRASMSACEAAIPEHTFPSQPRYTAYLDGKPVAVGSLVMAGDLAGVYAIATLPEARKRGIGAAMTLHTMNEGKARGAKLATLQASDMGIPVYERIGFSTVFVYKIYLQT